jgi:hypothetical protein
VSRQRKILEAQLARMEKPLRDAFLQSIADIKSTATISLIVGHLERGDLESAIAALGLRSEFLAPLDEALRAAYLEGGKAALAALPGPIGVKVRFDGRNQRAEAWLISTSSQKITNILADQRAGIRDHLEQGMRKGQNPRTTALDLIGRINKSTGKREGGILGLTRKQMKAVDAATEELADPTKLTSYLQRTRRDRRFDKLVKRYRADGKGLPVSKIIQIRERYSDRLLQLRAQTVARTESLAALNASQTEAMYQVIDNNQVPVKSVTKIWRTASDSRVRDTHAAMNGRTADLDMPFPNGLKHPGEEGGRASEVINCRCVVEMKVDYLHRWRKKRDG